MIFIKISQNFVKSPLKICFYLSVFSPQLMACMIYAFVTLYSFGYSGDSCQCGLDAFPYFCPYYL